MRLIFLTIILALVVSVDALAQDETLPPGTVEALERFYDNFNGDGWRNNGGWLDPAVNPCDWHGVFCAYSDGEFGVTALVLPDNNLEGSWNATDIAEHVLEDIELPGNRIDGTLTVLPVWLDELDLSDNELTGPLPPRPDTVLKPLDRLNLARNDFTGAIPENWSELEVDWLDLSNNGLEGSLAPLAFAGGWQGGNYFNLADNRFQGSVPVNLIRAGLYKHNDGPTAGGINLCWNDLEASDPEVRAWLDGHHVGGDDYASCLGRGRVAIGPEASGSWFDPARNGEGVVLQLLPGGGSVQYTFGFDNQGRQHWLLGVGVEEPSSLHWREMISTRGIFGRGEVAPDGPPFTQPPMGTGTNWRMDRVGANRFQIERTYHDFSHCEDGFGPLCAGDSLSDRLEYVRLSRLAGTTCDNRHENQWISGAWYDPARDGEGFVVEVLPEGRAVVYWFTYRPDDSRYQAWMTGVGEFDGQTLHVNDMVRPTGGGWGDNFDPEDVVFEPWGSLTMEFTGEDAGRVEWDSVQDGFGSGGYPVQRLNAVRLAECEEGQAAAR